MNEKFNHQIASERLKLAGLKNPQEVEASYYDPHRKSYPTFDKEILFWISVLKDGRTVKVAYQYYLDGIITLDVIRPSREELISEYCSFLNK